MCKDESGIPYLLACKQLEQTNHTRFINTVVIMAK